MSIVMGIDLAGMEKNDTGICTIDSADKQARTKIVHLDSEILSEVNKELPDLVCIDGPTTLPVQLSRKCDDELAQYGVLSPMMGGMRYLTMRASKLADALKSKGLMVIEVSNVATAKLLGFWDLDPAMRQKALVQLGISGDAVKRVLAKDEVDAITAAITGILRLERKTIDVGDNEGIIVVPKV